MKKTCYQVPNGLIFATLALLLCPTLAPRVTASGNQLPTIVLALPEPAHFFTPGTIRLAATASDPDGFVATVEFFADGTSVGVATNSCPPCANPTEPFQVVWTNPPVGVHQISATATDDLGGKSTSAAAKIDVIENPSPQAALTFEEPRDGAVFRAPADIPVVLHAFAPNDVIYGADLFANGDHFATAVFCCAFCPCAQPSDGQATVLQIPAMWEGGGSPPDPWRKWTNVPAGHYRLTARASGNNGTMLEAAPINVVVLPANELDLGLRIDWNDGTLHFVLPSGSLVEGGFDLHRSHDLEHWIRVGPFSPGNVAAFAMDSVTPGDVRPRFYRAVRTNP